MGSLLLGISIPLVGSAMDADAAPERTPEQRWTLSLYYENDMFANTDRYYTSGAKVTWISPDLSEFREAGRLPDAVYRIVHRLPFINRVGIQRNVAISLGQSIHTPIEVQRTDVIIDDQPYSGWLYIGAAFHNKTDHWLDTIEINLGVVGPLALGRQMQNGVHRIRDIPVAKGWDNQLRNEPALNLIWERKYRRDLLGDGNGFGIDVLGHLGASLGNVYTYANTGGGVRIGWNLPRDFGAALIRLAGDTNAPAASDDVRYRAGAWSFHLFSSVDGRAVARDITLDGNSWNDSHSVDKDNWVGDLSLGAGIIFRGWKLSYAQTIRSRTFKGGKQHAFGSFNVSLTY
jgi:hypothetical protein